MIKKKGSIVPRYLVDAIEKKSQHLIKFGCDVKIEGSKVTSLSEGNMFVIPGNCYCNLKKKKGTQKRKWKGCVVGDNLVLYGDYTLHSAFYVHSDITSQITIQSPVNFFIL